MVPTDPWTDALADCLLQSLDLGDDDTDAASSVVSFPSTCFPSLTESSCTSLDSFSRRSGSPTPSVFSVTSSVRAQAYRELHGRAVNNYSDVYRLPADEKELDRLGLYLPPSPLFHHGSALMMLLKICSTRCSRLSWASTRHQWTKSLPTMSSRTRRPSLTWVVAAVAGRSHALSPSGYYPAHTSLPLPG